MAYSIIGTLRTLNLLEEDWIMWDMLLIFGMCGSGVFMVIFLFAMILPAQGHGGNPKRDLKILVFLTIFCAAVLFTTASQVLVMR